MADLPEGAKLVFVNWVRVVPTPFDLGMDLGYHDAPGPPDSFPVRAVMSWEQAKALLELVGGAVEAYEQQAGPIRDMIDRSGASDGSDDTDA